MVELQKIDAFFNRSIDLQKRGRQTFDRRARVLHFAKLIMPSIAAVLLAFILVLPNLKKNNIIAEYDMTLPKKGELEKLHAEDTTFSVTDKDGKITIVTADSMDEIDTKSKIIKIINPKANIPIDVQDRFISVKADTGFFEQTENIIRLKQNVEAVYDEETTIQTQEALYDFKNSYGQGNKPIYAHGSWGKLWADGFSYDKVKDILYLNKNSKVEREESVLTASKQIRYYKNLSKIEAEEDVVLTRPDSTLYADNAIVFLVSVQDMNIKKIEAFGHVQIETKGAVAKGDCALYLPYQEEVELNGNVSIEKEGHIVYGDKAVINLATTVSKLIALSEKKRVSGVIKGSSIKRK